MTNTAIFNTSNKNTNNCGKLRETDRQIDRQTDRQTDRQKQRNRGRKRQTEAQREKINESKRSRARESGNNEEYKSNRKQRNNVQWLKCSVPVVVCKSMNFRSSKSYFSPQNAHSSSENLMKPLSNTKIHKYPNDAALTLFASRLCQWCVTIKMLHPFFEL